MSEPSVDSAIPSCQAQAIRFSPIMTTSLRNRLILILLAIGVVAAVALLAPRSRNDVVLGAVLPLTGDAGTFGRNAQRGALLAIEFANQTRLLGDRVVRLDSEDSRGAAQDAATAARKLIDISHVNGLIGDVTSAATHAILPIVDKAQVPTISPAASDPRLSGASSMFARVWPSDSYEASVVGSYAVDKGYSAIAVLFANTDYGVAMNAQFAKAIPASAIAMTIPLERETLDYRPTIQRLRAQRIDSIFMVFYPEDAKRLLDQLAEQRVEAPILATATFEDPLLLKSPLSQRVVFASPVPPDERDASRSDFIRRYTAKFGEAPAVLSDTGYDAAMILLQAFAVTGPQKAAEVMQHVRGLRDYPGVSGKMTFDAGGDVQKKYALRTVRDDTFDWLTSAPGSGGNAPNP